MSRSAPDAGTTREAGAPEAPPGCSLPPRDLRERIRWIRAEILPHAVASERLADGAAWELAEAPGLAERLDRLVALEADCCSQAVFEHGPGAEPGQRRLVVRGLDPSSPVLGELGGPTEKTG